MRFLLYVSVLVLVGCGGCPQVSLHRSDFLKTQKTAVDGTQPHMMLEVSRELIDSTLDKVLGKLPKVSTQLKGLGEVGKFLDRLSIRARDLRMELDRVKAARIDLDLDIRYRGRRLFGMLLTASAPVKYSPKTGVMEIVVNHNLFARRIEPKVSDKAIDKLTASLRREIPRYCAVSISQIHGPQICEKRHQETQSGPVWSHSQRNVDASWRINPVSIYVIAEIASAQDKRSFQQTWLANLRLDYDPRRGIHPSKKKALKGKACVLASRRIFWRDSETGRSTTERFHPWLR